MEKLWKELEEPDINCSRADTATAQLLAEHKKEQKFSMTTVTTRRPVENGINLLSNIL